MAFKSKAEKIAFRIGLLRGLFRKKKGASKKSSGGARKKLYYKKTPPKKQSKKPRPGAYTSRGRINENLVDDRHGPVVFWDGDDFDYDSR